MEPLTSLLNSALETATDLLYVKYFVAFFVVILTAALGFCLIRIIAAILVWIALLGAVAIVCYGIYEGSIATWQDLLMNSVVMGAIASAISTPILLFTIAPTQGKSSDKQQNADQPQ